MGRVDPHPLDNIIEFHGLSPNPLDLDLAWHEHALARGGGVVRLPIKQAEALSKLRQKFAEIRHHKGEDPTVEELAQALDMAPEEVDDLLRVYRPSLSLDRPMAEDSDTTPLDLLQSRTLPSTEDAYAQASMYREVADLLEHSLN